jgi:hypothetical protein
MPDVRSRLAPWSAGLLLALTPLAGAVAAQAPPALRTALESPARVQPVYYWRGGYYPYHHHNHYYRYRYHGSYCNHRAYIHGYWRCRW